MPRLTVAIFVDVFPPSMGGGATRAFQIAKSLAALNCEIFVITGSHIYPTGKSFLILRPHYECLDNLNVIRVPSLNMPFKGLLNRIVNYVFCCISMLIYAPKLKGINVVFSLGMHPFTDPAAYLVRLINPKSHFIIDFSDVFPENSLYGRINNAISRILLCISDFVTVHNDRMKHLFALRYRCNKKIFVFYNAVDTDVFRPSDVARGEKKILSKLCGRPLSNNIVVCYFGVFGPFQGLNRVLKAASILQRELDDILFCLIGDGEQKPLLVKLASNVGNVFLLPQTSRNLIPLITSEADVGLVPLISSDYFLVYTNLPTKAAEFLASGTPIITTKGTFIGDIVLKWGAGYCVNFNSVEDICNCLRHIYNNVKELMSKSINARSLAINVFSSRELVRRMSLLLAEISHHDLTHYSLCNYEYQSIK